jgi:hypothetical protein
VAGEGRKSERRCGALELICRAGGEDLLVVDQDIRSRDPEGQNTKSKAKLDARKLLGESRRRGCGETKEINSLFRIIRVHMWEETRGTGERKGRTLESQRK